MRGRPSWADERRAVAACGCRSVSGCARCRGGRACSWATKSGFARHRHRCSWSSRPRRRTRRRGGRAPLARTGSASRALKAGGGSASPNRPSVRPGWTKREQRCQRARMPHHCGNYVAGMIAFRSKLQLRRSTGAAPAPCTTGGALPAGELPERRRSVLPKVPVHRVGSLMTIRDHTT